MGTIATATAGDSLNVFLLVFLSLLLALIKVEFGRVSGDGVRGRKNGAYDAFCGDTMSCFRLSILSRFNSLLIDSFKFF